MAKEYQLKNIANCINIFKDLLVPQYVIFVWAIFILFSIIFGYPNIELRLLFQVLLIFPFLIFGLNALNQVYDLTIDKINKPLRPIPSRRITSRTTKILTLTSYLIALLISVYSLNSLVLVLVLIFIVLSILYSIPLIRLKRFFLSTMIVGATLYGAIPFILAWTLFSDGTNFPWFLFLFFYILLVIISNTKDFEDYEGDKQNKIKTLQVITGVQKAKIIIVISIFLLIFVSTLLLLFHKIENFLTVPLLISICLLLVLIYKLIHIPKNSIITQKITTQASIVSFGMIVYILILLSFALTFLLVK